VNLIRSINHFVVEDTDGWSMASGNQLPAVSRSTERLITPLAQNLDVPARLAPAPGAPDRRPEIRAALTEVVADCAYTLEPDGPLPAPGHPAGRDRLAIATSRAYAAFATPRLAPRLFANGRADDLGTFPPPQLRGDAAAARAMAVAISARTGQGEEAVLTALVAAGRGAAAPAAAKMLLDAKMGFKTLPEPEQRAGVRLVAEQLEIGFAARDAQPAGVNELAEALQTRQGLAGRGAGAVDMASRVAGQEIQALHELLDRLPDWHPAVETQDPAARFAADPAVAPLRTIQTSATTPASARTAVPEQKSHGLDR
jgi:hypothetical protein